MKTRKAFTVIELIICAAIAFLLLGIIVPVVAGRMSGELQFKTVQSVEMSQYSNFVTYTAEDGSTCEVYTDGPRAMQGENFKGRWEKH